MAQFDRQFEILKPDLGMIYRDAIDVADPTLLNPTNSLAFVDGEFIQLDANRKVIRASDAAKIAFPLLDERGDYGVQGMKKLTCVIGPRGYRAKTVIYAPTSVVSGAFGTLLEVGTVNSARTGSVNRKGLVIRSSGLTVGAIFKAPATDGQPLEYIDLMV